MSKKLDVPKKCFIVPEENSIFRRKFLYQGGEGIGKEGLKKSEFLARALEKGWECFDEALKRESGNKKTLN